MRRALSFVGNASAVAALILLILDPARDLTPVFVLLGVAVVFAWVLPQFVPPKA
jgi:hypothetical protein